MTLRHAIAKSGTNTLEGYFHPRQLAFAFGVLAIAQFLRGRYLGMLLGLAAAPHFIRRQHCGSVSGSRWDSSCPADDRGCH